MKFVIKIYTKDCFIGDAYAKTIKEAKCKASKMCNGYFSVYDTFVIVGGKYDGIIFNRFNTKDPCNRITRGQWR